MGIAFSLTDAGRRVHDQPSLYPHHGTAEMRSLLVAQAHDGLSFDDIGETFRVLQEMATGMAMGLLETDDASPQRPDKDRGLGHGRW